MFEQFPKVYFISLTWSNSREVGRLRQTEISFSSSILFVPYSSGSLNCIHGEPWKLCYLILDHNPYFLVDFYASCISADRNEYSTEELKIYNFTLTMSPHPDKIKAHNSIFWITVFC